MSKQWLYVRLLISHKYKIFRDTQEFVPIRTLITASICEWNKAVFLIGFASDANQMAQKQWGAGWAAGCISWGVGTWEIRTLTCIRTHISTTKTKHM
jgi:hypothetical protein